MLGEVESIANLGVKPVFGECSYEIFRMKGGQHKEAQYQIGTIFEVEIDVNGSMVVIDPDGDRVLVSAGERQCFREMPPKP